MALALYGHPFSSYTWKVLIALYENDTPFEFRQVGPDQPDHTQAWLARWPIAKFPLLVDRQRQFAESSVIIEYLQQRYPGPVPLLPEDADLALEARFLDRAFDLHVMDAVQWAVMSALGRLPIPREAGLALTRERLERSYGWLECHLRGRTWAVGEVFTIADCAAAPALFYADWTCPIPESHTTLRAYRARLLARPSVARAVDEARPYRPLFPLGAPDRD